MKKITLLLIPLFTLSFLLGCDGDLQKNFTITWANYDGTVLSTTNVKRGVVPTYDKEEPTRPEDERGIRYTFSGWSPKVVAATKSTTYTAAYSETYKITFDAETGSFTEGKKQKIVWCARGKTPVCDEEPLLDGELLFKFAGWNREVVPAVEPAIYTATYDVQSAHYHLKLTYKYGSGDLANVGFEHEGNIESVDWGDGTIDKASSHKYSGGSGSYTIEIKGNFKKFVLHNGEGHSLVQPGNANITEVEFVEDANEDAQGCVKLDNYAFYKCTSIKKVVLPSTLRWFGINPFGDCELIESLEIDDDNAYLTDGGVNAIINKNSKILILGTVATNIISSNENIRSIAPYAFDAIKKFFGIHVDCKLDKIETFAFYDCKNIVIYLDKHVDGMKNNIFRKFSTFDNISVALKESEEEAKTYPKNAFDGASSITYSCTGYNLENDVLYIRDNRDGNGEVARVVTGNRKKLESEGSVTILSGVENTTTNESIPVVEISDNAFNGFNGIQSVNFPSNCQIKTFGSSAFAECGLVSLVIPNSVTTIKKNCFYAGPHGLFVSRVTYHIPKNVVNIEKRAFYFSETMDFATINCEAESKPDGWDDTWWDLALDTPTHCDVTINWNVSPPIF